MNNYPQFLYKISLGWKLCVSRPLFSDDRCIWPAGRAYQQHCTIPDQTNDIMASHDLLQPISSLENIFLQWKYFHKYWNYREKSLYSKRHGQLNRIFLKHFVNIYPSFPPGSYMVCLFTSCKMIHFSTSTSAEITTCDDWVPSLAFLTGLPIPQ